MAKARGPDSTAGVETRSGICEMCRCDCASPTPSTYTGSVRRSWARSLEVSTTAPPPSVSRQQSNADSGLETIRDARTSSIVSGDRTKAFGFIAAQARAATATSARSRRVVPNWYMCRSAASAYMLIGARGRYGVS